MTLADPDPIAAAYTRATAAIAPLMRAVEHPIMARPSTRARHRVPPFADTPSAHPPASDEAGARVLAARIKAAWKRVGHDVDVTVHYVPSVERDDGLRTKATWEIRSSLVNGLPR